MVLINALALLRQLIYLLANKTSVAPSTLLLNPKSAAFVPGNQCLKALKRVFADPLVLLVFVGLGRVYGIMVRKDQQGKDIFYTPIKFSSLCILRHHQRNLRCDPLQLLLSGH